MITIQATMRIFSDGYYHNFSIHHKEFFIILFPPFQHLLSAPGSPYGGPFRVPGPIWKWQVSK